MNLNYYNCYRHYPGEDNRGKYIFEIYLNDELIENVYDANMVEDWVRLKVFDLDGNVKASSKHEGIVRIHKNYDY